MNVKFNEEPAGIRSVDLQQTFRTSSASPAQNTDSSQQIICRCLLRVQSAQLDSFTWSRNILFLIRGTSAVWIKVRKTLQVLSYGMFLKGATRGRFCLFWVGVRRQVAGEHLRSSSPKSKELRLFILKKIVRLPSDSLLFAVLNFTGCLWSGYLQAACGLDIYRLFAESVTMKAIFIFR